MGRRQCWKLPPQNSIVAYFFIGLTQKWTSAPRVLEYSTTFEQELDFGLPAISKVCRNNQTVSMIYFTAIQIAAGRDLVEISAFIENNQKCYCLFVPVFSRG